MTSREKSSPIPPFYLYADGASRGNPGDAGYGALITDGNGRIVAEIRGYLGKTTNNVAEYQALIHGLKKALALGIPNIRVLMDSQLVVRQIQGSYRVRQPHLKPLHNQAKQLLAKFLQSQVQCIPREKNERADELASRAIEEHLGKRAMG